MVKFRQFAIEMAVFTGKLVRESHPPHHSEATKSDEKMLQCSTGSTD